MKYCDELIFQFYRKSFGDGSGGGSGIPGGNDRSIQYNANGAFGGDSFLLYDYGTQSMGLGEIDINSALYIRDISGKIGLRISANEIPLDITSSSSVFRFNVGVSNASKYQFYMYQPIEGYPNLNLINLNNNRPTISIRGDNNWVGINLTDVNDVPIAPLHIKNSTASGTLILENYTDSTNTGTEIRLFKFSSTGGDIPTGDKVTSFDFYARSGSINVRTAYIESRLEAYRSGSIAFYTRNSTTDNLSIYINRYGSVGIGRTPSYKLDVGGTFRVLSDGTYNTIRVDASNNMLLGDLNNKISITMFGGDSTRNVFSIYTMSRFVKMDGYGRVGIGGFDSSYTLTVDSAKLRSEELLLTGISGTWRLVTPAAGTFDSGFYLYNITDNVQAFFSRQSNWTDPNNGEPYKRISLHLIDRNRSTIYRGEVRYCDFSIVTPNGFTILSRVSQTQADRIINDWQQYQTNQTVFINQSRGSLFFDTSTNRYKYWDGTKWIIWRDIDVPNDPDYVVLSDGNGGLYTSLASGYHFKFDTTANAVIIGTNPTSNYQTFNLVGDRPQLTLAHNVHNAGEASITFSTSSGTTRYPHAGMFSVSYGAAGGSDLRLCAVYGTDSTTVTSSNWYMLINPRDKRVTFSAQDVICYYDNPRFVIQARSNSSQTAWLVFKHAEDKCAIVSKNYSTYGRADFRVLVNDQAISTPLDIAADCVLFARDYYDPNNDIHYRRVGINTINPAYSLHVNGDAYVTNQVIIGDGSADAITTVLTTNGALTVNGDLNVTGSKNAVIKTTVNGTTVDVYARAVETPFQSWIMWQFQGYINYRQDFKLPEEFTSIVDLSAGNYMVYVQSIDVYGRSGYRLIYGNTIRVYVDYPGTYNVMIMARRKDTMAADSAARNKFASIAGV